MTFKQELKQALKRQLKKELSRIINQYAYTDKEKNETYDILKI